MYKNLFKRPLQFFGNKLQLDANYFTWGALYTGLQQIVGAICGLLVTYILGNYVSKTIFGEYNLVISTLSLITFLSLPGIDTALVQSVGRGFDLSFPQAVSLKIKFSLLGSLALVGFAIFYFLSQKAVISTGLLFVAFIYPLLYSFSLTSAFLTAKRKFNILTILSSFSSVAFLVITVISVLISPTVLGLTIGYTAGLIIPAGFSYIFSLRYVNTHSTADPGLVSYSSFLTLLSILPWISSYLGQIILGNIIGAQSLAIFTIANSFLASVQKNFIIFYKPITAKLANQSTREQLATIQIHGLKFIGLGIMLAIILWISTPILINIFFPQYKEALNYAQLLSLALIPLPITWVLSDIMIYQKRKSIQLFASTLPHILKIFLFFVLIPRLGILGLVLVTLIDRYVSFVILAFPIAYKFLKK